MASSLTVAVAALALVNLIAWAAFRVDKARATRGGRRVRERTLLGLAALGGAAGALVAMYGHRQRHKTRKRAFAAVVWLAAIAWTSAAALVLVR